MQSSNFFFFLSPLYFDAANQAVLTSQSDQSVLFKRCVDLCIQTVFPIVLLACMFCFPCSLGNLLFVCFFLFVCFYFCDHIALECGAIFLFHSSRTFLFDACLAGYYDTMHRAAYIPSHDQFDEKLS